MKASEVRVQVTFALGGGVHTIQAEFMIGTTKHLHKQGVSPSIQKWA